MRLPGLLGGGGYVGNESKAGWAAGRQLGGWEGEQGWTWRESTGDTGTDLAVWTGSSTIDDSLFSSEQLGWETPQSGPGPRAVPCPL